MTVKPYEPTLFPEVLSWWLAHGEVAPNEAMLPPESTFVAWQADAPVAALTVYLTNSTFIAYLENLVSAPGLPREARRRAVEALVAHAEAFARERGVKALLCMSEKDKLAARYEELGYTPTLRGVTTLAKYLGV